MNQIISTYFTSDNSKYPKLIKVSIIGARTLLLMGHLIDH